MASLLPLAALSLTIGFSETVFWRGWVLLRLEEGFGIVPTLIRDGLSLPVLSAVGLAEVMIVIWVLVWLAARHFKKAARREADA